MKTVTRQGNNDNNNDHIHRIQLAVALMHCTIALHGTPLMVVYNAKIYYKKSHFILLGRAYIYIYIYKVKYLQT